MATRTVRMFKMPFKTKAFNANQKVWVIFTTGACAAYVTGKFRGKGRYVNAWVNWSAKHKAPPRIVEVEVTKEFAERMLIP